LDERDACVTCKSSSNVSTWLVYTQVKWWTDAYDLISFISVGVAGLISLPPLHIDAFMIVPYISGPGWVARGRVDTRYCGYI